jgi:hypothetical protein
MAHEGSRRAGMPGSWPRLRMLSVVRSTTWSAWPCQTSFAVDLAKPLVCSQVGYCGMPVASPAVLIETSAGPSCPNAFAIAAGTSS